MNPKLIFFFITGITALVSALMMVTRSNPIRSVLFLIINFFSLAVLYLTLHAQFIAIIQILVYAGAIMVLFLFVIMLLNLSDEKRLNEKKEFKKMAAGILGVIVFSLIALGESLSPSSMGKEVSPNSVTMGTVESIGGVLFKEYLLPFEITSILLLAALVGVLVLAKKKFE